MTNRALTSTTAVALCLSLAAPAPLLAQDQQNRPFPCVAPTGAIADTPKALSDELMALTTTDAQAAPQADAGDVQVCSPGAIQRGIDRGGEELAAAMQAAPQQVQNQLAALTEAAPAEPTPQANAQANAQDNAQAEAPQAQTPANDAPAQTAQDKAKPVGEAGQQRLTEEQRQRLAEVRAERRAAIAAVREEAREATAAARTETRTVTEDDVRKADEDFDTAANGSGQAQAQQQDEDDSKLSTFEKALLLGLGTAVVGSILNNGDEVVSNSGDRVVVERDGELKVLKNDDELLAQPGAEVQSQTFEDGSTRETITYADGSQTITVRAPDGTVLRRSMIQASNGEEVVLFDDTQEAEPIDFDALPQSQTVAFRQSDPTLTDQQALEAALQKAIAQDLDRRFSLNQVRSYKQVRALAPEIELDSVTFATGSAAIQPSQAEALAALGQSMRDIIASEPDSVFLIEGHTDAVGTASTNLALSDRRAETVALALTQYFDVPPQNLITQGYGESDLKIAVLTDERANRRAAVRNITDLLY
ncbi:MAG: hypothetical protein CML68_22705 [Rhodobacteraceae bacterium]|nr:hypothetical protein [Paracoccaceae bacterium]